MWYPIVDGNTWWTTIILFVAGYLIGCFILSRVYISIFRKGNTTFKLKNGKTHTMKSFGTSATSKAIGSKFAIAQFLIDLIKPWILILFIYLPLSNNVSYFAHSMLFFGLLGTLLGHNYPIFWKFKGGEGVATGLGCILAVNWIAGLIAFASWAIILYYKRNQLTATFWAVTIGVLINLVAPIFNVPILPNYSYQQYYYSYFFIAIWLTITISQYKNKTQKTFFKSVSFWVAKPDGGSTIPKWKSKRKIHFNDLREYQIWYNQYFQKLVKSFKDKKIEWFAHSGTLLGTIRHKGFIPWDDDIDMGMDYFEFQTKKDEIKTIVDSIDEEKKWKLKDLYEQKWDFPKIFYDVECSINLNEKIYIFKPCVDIMLGTFDHTVDFKKLPRIIKTELFLYFLEDKLLFNKHFLSKIFQKKHLKIFESSKRNVEKNKFRLLYIDSWRDDIYDLTDIEFLPFENGEIPVPKNPEKVLVKSFGDWKKIPTEKKDLKPKHIINNWLYIN